MPVKSLFAPMYHLCYTKEDYRTCKDDFAMVRKALIYILVLAAVSMVLSAMFVKAADVCEELYEGVEIEDVEIHQFVPMHQGRVAIIGRYNQGPNAGDIYYQIFQQEQGKMVGKAGSFGLEGASLHLAEVIPVSDGLRFVCVTRPRNTEETAYGTVWDVSRTGTVSQPVLFKGTGGDALYGFDHFVCADTQGRYYAGIYNQRVLIFNRQGEVVQRITPEQTREVTDVFYTGDGFLLSGCTSESGLHSTVHRAFCALYDYDGTVVWRKSVMGEEGTLASVLEILHNGEAGWVLYGRFTQDAKTEEITAGAQIEAFDAGEKGMFFQLEGDETLRSNTFLVALSPDGQVTEQVAYSDIAPTLVREGLRVGGGLMLQAYVAERPGASRYVVKTIRVNNRLQETLRVELPAWGDQAMYCTPWADSEEGLWVYYAGQVRYFAREREALAHFTRFMRWRPVCDCALSVREGAPFMVSLYIVMTVCTLGTVRSPHSRQYGRGKRKA